VFKVVTSVPFVFFVDSSAAATVTALLEAVTSISCAILAESVTATCSPSVLCAGSPGPSTVAAAGTPAPSAAGYDAPARTVCQTNNNFMPALKLMKSSPSEAVSVIFSACKISFY
jgi:hypothetical protein